MTATAQLAEGTELAGFTVLREIGRGGMGVVYLAEQSSLGRRVALKVIAPALAGDPQFRERFEREAHHAASIEHPNVIPVFQAGTEDGHLYLAMRYVEGEDLGAVIRRRGPLDPAAAAGVVAQVGAALDAAHSKGLVHRDVKPANILLDRGEPDGHAYLTDFGLTKEQAAVSGLTNTGAWVGTVDYVPPEQIDGRGVEARSDVYSLACVLYEALAGKVPYEGAATQKMWAHMSEPPPSLAAARPELAAVFDPVLERGLAKSADGRYPSAGDLGRAAAAAAAGTDVAMPERSVATGVAATPVAPPGARETRAAATEAASPSESERPTRRLAPDGPPATEKRGERAAAPLPDHGRGSRRVLAVAAVAVAVAAGVGAAALVANSLEEDPAPVASDSPAAVTTTADGGGGGGGGAPAESAPADPEPGGSSFPGGQGFTAILASKESEAEAERISADAQADGLDSGVLFSSDYSSLNPGFWVVYSGAFDSQQEAQTEVETARSAGYSDAYVREIAP